MGRHINENFLNKFLGKNLLTEDQKRAVALKNRKSNYLKNYYKNLEEKNSGKLSKNINEDVTTSIKKIFYRTKDQLNESRSGMQNLIPYYTPYGIIFFNKDTQEWTNTFGQVVDPMDFMNDFSHDDSSSSGDGETSQNIIVPPLPPELYPNPPKDLQVVSFNNTGATLSWIDDSINEEGFKLFYYRARPGDYLPDSLPQNINSFVTVGSSDTDVSLQFIDENLSETGFRIYYREYIDGLTSPAPPVSFSAERINTNTIQLNWIDTATDEDGFKVFYSEP